VVTSQVAIIAALNTQIDQLGTVVAAHFGQHPAASHSSKAASAQPVRQEKKPAWKSARSPAAAGGLAWADRVCGVLINHLPSDSIYTV
jgi:hypothetical protein